jgi:predicted nucleic acid-binding Zn ribbon protein
VKNICILSLICLSISACSSASYEGNNFESMSAQELLEYNRGKPLAQMIVCTDDQQRTMSRVRRRQCATVERMYGSVEQAEKLGVINSAPRL